MILSPVPQKNSMLKFWVNIFWQNIERKKYSGGRFFPKQMMLYFEKMISSILDKEIKDFWLRNKTIGF